MIPERADLYVYGLFRRATAEPYYVGKGYGRRMFWHENRYASDPNAHKARIIRKELAQYGSILKIKLSENLRNSEAMVIEIAFIAELGRYPDGKLTNLTSGGDGCADLSPDRRKRLSEAAKARMTNPAAREQSRMGAKKQWADPEMRSHLSALVRDRDRFPTFSGHRHTMESREKMSRSRIGYTHREDSKAKMRENALAQWGNPATRDFMRERMRGSKQPKSHCPHGHELAGANLVLKSNGTRFCRICNCLKSQRYRARRKSND